VRLRAALRLGGAAAVGAPAGGTVAPLGHRTDQGEAGYEFVGLLATWLTQYGEAVNDMPAPFAPSQRVDREQGYDELVAIKNALRGLDCSGHAYAVLVHRACIGAFLLVKLHDGVDATTGPPFKLKQRTVELTSIGLSAHEPVYLTELRRMPQAYDDQPHDLVIVRGPRLAARDTSPILPEGPAERSQLRVLANVEFHSPDGTRQLRAFKWAGVDPKLTALVNASQETRIKEALSKATFDRDTFVSLCQTWVHEAGASDLQELCERIKSFRDDCFDSLELKDTVQRMCTQARLFVENNPGVASSITARTERLVELGNALTPLWR
jgi:hypothetical protein